MIKKTIKFTDLDGKEREEDFFFHLSKADIAKMQLSVIGDFHGYLKQIVEVGNPEVIIETFEKIIKSTIGQRTADGGFLKDKAITDAFCASEAYSVLFIELVTDAGKASEFIRGVVPKDLASNMPEIAPAALEQAEAPKEPKKLEEYTQQELLEMPWAEFNALLKGIPGKNIPKEFLMVAMQKKPDNK